MRSHERQRGASLVAAIFLIVVLAMLAAIGLRVGVGQQHTVNLSLLGARALSAAYAGVEWGAHRALMQSQCAASSTFALTEGALSGFTVDVQCTRSEHIEGDPARPTYVYSIEAFAHSGSFGSPDYASRRVRARFADAP